MKKNTKLIISTVIGLICVLVIVVVYFQFTASFPLKTSFPEYPENMVLYEVTGEINQQFGALDYGFTSSKIPTEAEAINIAEAYLASNDLFPNDAVFGYAELVMGYLSSDGDIVQENAIEYSITYNRELSGYPVVGPGDTVWVAIAQDNQVVFYYKNWRALQEANAVEIITPQEAYDKLVNGEIIETPLSSESFEIYTILLGYYAFAADQEYYEPVWIFYGPDGSQLYYSVVATKINAE
ncbi:MAG: hypothetical protein KKC68_01330 [Candidatus Thermoplasmatota archaeon]|nr:hypothetical protein [Candidatus Thermoplasmatota archaeon]MBU1940392.1 hypothetical protein [Candidatus Thermoplasmatota archaeon]